jgi:lysozyme
VKTNEAGRALIRQHEGCRLETYLCPAGVPTVGYGHTGPEVKLGQRITQHQADVILEHDLERFEEAVGKLAPRATSNQFSALVSFAFNLGVAALAESTLLKRFLSGGPLAAAPEFDKWVHAGGKVLPGLVARRAAEKALFLS